MGRQLARPVHCAAGLVERRGGGSGRIPQPGPRLAPPTSGVYDFDDNSFQGWSPYFIFNGIASLASGGNPGNRLATDDTTPGGAGLYFRGPPAFAGNLSGWAGVAWDEYLPPQEPGGNTTLFLESTDYTTWQNNSQPVGGYGVWNQRWAPFDEANWTRLNGSSSFASSLANVLRISLDVEVTSGMMDEASIDNIRLEAGNSPFITEQPQATVWAELGGDATFTVTALGEEPLHYQWQFNGTELADRPVESPADRRAGDQCWRLSCDCHQCVGQRDQPRCDFDHLRHCNKLRP